MATTASSKARATMMPVSASPGHTPISMSIAELDSRSTAYYTALRNFLEPVLGSAGFRAPTNSPRRDKLMLLPVQQLLDFAMDVVDDANRRAENDPLAPFLHVRMDLPATRNQSRQKLATIPPAKFNKLALELLLEVERRFPKTLSNYRKSMAAPSSASSSNGPSTPSSAHATLPSPLSPTATSPSLSKSPNRQNLSPQVQQQQQQIQQQQKAQHVQQRLQDKLGIAIAPRDSSRDAQAARANSQPGSAPSSPVVGSTLYPNRFPNVTAGAYGSAASSPMSPTSSQPLPFSRPMSPVSPMQSPQTPQHQHLPAPQSPGSSRSRSNGRDRERDRDRAASRTRQPPAPSTARSDEKDSDLETTLDELNARLMSDFAVGTAPSAAMNVRRSRMQLINNQLDSLHNMQRDTDQRRVSKSLDRHSFKARQSMSSSGSLNPSGTPDPERRQAEFERLIADFNLSLAASDMSPMFATLRVLLTACKAITEDAEAYQDMSLAPESHQRIENTKTNLTTCSKNLIQIAKRFTMASQSSRNRELLESCGNNLLLAFRSLASALRAAINEVEERLYGSASVSGRSQSSRGMNGSTPMTRAKSATRQTDASPRSVGGMRAAPSNAASQRDDRSRQQDAYPASPRQQRQPPPLTAQQERMLTQYRGSVEDVTDTLAHKIQLLLSMMRDTYADGETIQNVMDDVASDIDVMILQTENIGRIVDALAQDLADTRQSLLASRQTLDSLGEQVLIAPHNRALKQKIANATYELAKHAKALLQLLQ